MKKNNRGETQAISLRVDVSLLEEVKKIVDTLSISTTEFIRRAIEKEVKETKDDFFYMLLQVDYCSEEESNEIIKELKTLKKEDLEVAERIILPLNDLYMEE
ncbi:ribbon-helix-helix protein, CopG family [Fusobacterium necrophorum]|uniref:Ribbon-helix-helix protein CopG domain-containing protein n=1 Tax=Fusobacterium necrophorum BL TaxID=1441732 RepID=A0AB73BWG0_9FUSO|nr:ribbon-helix-helix protein, CopG family [Fusobacterium necrophorum]AYZ73648.1 ribbon-helix-helix protein, CopG family [Fusobacterium necrophorum]AZW08348.1 ribbon-helix-helix protein, CopG family [Fusobacterium necrophorum subsp. necrophorum]KDE62969.1 hypothetical protein FUSO3_06435 [Fusobacterium necrophorum BL]KDE69145.1 hypothetical protein FUSO6_07265 [Fusobacterium necrophorum DAB]SDB49063.1 Ribbon-helix-helix protein, copG family [Fusobacterium necrophorum]